MNKTTWIVVGVLGGILLLALGTLATGVATYNKLVRESTAIDAQAAQVDVQYQRAFRVVPQLVNLTTQYMQNERDVMENVTALRSGLASAANGTFQAKDAYAAQLGSFIALVGNRLEAYPKLKSNELFEDTMLEVINTENKIAVEKTRYNDNVEAYNGHIRECCIPVLIANGFGFGAKEYIRFGDRPNVFSLPAGQSFS